MCSARTKTITKTKRRTGGKKMKNQDTKKRSSMKIWMKMESMKIWMKMDSQSIDSSASIADFC